MPRIRGRRKSWTATKPGDDLDLFIAAKESPEAWAEWLAQNPDIAGTIDRDAGPSMPLPGGKTP